MPPILQCSSIVKHYGTLTALGGIDFNIESGKITGLLGPNGSGKTTFLKIAAGLLSPNSGQILIDGKKIGKDTKAMVSYLPERTYFDLGMKVCEAIDMFKDFYSDFNEQRANEMISRLSIDTSKKFKTLSKGTQEKVQLILVMSRDAKLYLLDEPIGGVDPAARDYILDTVISNYNREAAILISTHLIADVEKVLDNFVFLKNGIIVTSSTADEVHAQNKTIDELFREVFRC